MAYRRNYGDPQPDKDTGWGLIFRLNGLFEVVDYNARHGNYNAWEIALDRIFCNLMYRSEPIIVKDEESGEILDVQIDDEDYKVYEKVKSKISKSKAELNTSMKKKNLLGYKKAKVDYYNTLIFYDIWLRKFMQQKKLYLKETERNPSRAMWGG